MLMSEAERKAKMDELKAKKEHKSKMESNFVKFRYKSNNSIKRKRSNNKHSNGRNKGQNNVQSEESQQRLQQYTQADEFDILALVDKKLLPSEAFVPNQQDYLPNDSSLWSLEQWLNATNQIAPPIGLDFNIFNQSPQCPMFPTTNLQSPTQNMLSPLHCPIEPFMTALTIEDPFANLFPASNQGTNITVPSANAESLATNNVVPSISTEPTVVVPSNQVVQPIFNNIVVPSINTEPIFTNTTATSISTEQPSRQSTTLQASDMPSRPDPPKFKDGPRYVRASEDFIDYFRKIDTDDSGTISFNELKGSLFNKGEHRHQNFCSQAVYILIEMFDKNNDGTIDKEEFPELLAFIRNWEQCFLFLDSDDSGTINYQEMHIAIQALGLRDFGGLCLSKLLYQYDPTGNLEIDFDNFILICVSVVRFNDTFRFMQKTFGPHGIRGLTLEDLITSCGKRMYHHHVINK